MRDESLDVDQEQVEADVQALYEAGIFSKFQAKGLCHLNILLCYFLTKNTKHFFILLSQGRTKLELTKPRSTRS